MRRLSIFRAWIAMITGTFATIAFASVADDRCSGPEISFEKNGCGYYLSVTTIDGSDGYMDQCSPENSEIVRRIRQECRALAARVNVPADKSCDGAIQITTLGGGYQIWIASKSGKQYGIQDIAQNNDPRIQAIREDCARYYRKVPPTDAARINSNPEKKQIAPAPKSVPAPSRSMRSTPST